MNESLIKYVTYEEMYSTRLTVGELEELGRAWKSARILPDVRKCQEMAVWQRDFQEGSRRFKESCRAWVSESASKKLAPLPRNSRLKGGGP
jgi:hypothetical protein